MNNLKEARINLLRQRARQHLENETSLIVSELKQQVDDLKEDVRKYLRGSDEGDAAGCSGGSLGAYRSGRVLGGEARSA